MKRLTASSDAEATKERRTENSTIANTLCEQCLQRECRIEEYIEQINKLYSEEEYQVLTYKNSLNNIPKRRNYFGH